MKVKFGESNTPQKIVLWEDLVGGLWQSIDKSGSVILVAEDDCDCRIYIGAEGVVEVPRRWEEKKFVRLNNSIILEND